MAAVVLGRLFTALMVLLLAAPAFADPPVADAEPLIVYIETDPWAMVIGSDSPRFVLYEDGTVIYRTETGYQAVTLAAADSAALAAKVKLAGINDYTDYTKVTDQPSSIIIDFRDKLAVVAYGATSQHRDRGDASDRLLSMITLLREYRSPDAAPWEPDAIEVMIWPYEYAPEASIIWPAEWPGLDHAATVQRGDSYSLFIPISDKDALLAFLETRKARGAVEIGGKKMGREPAHAAARRGALDAEGERRSG
ncbi:hypothetical protein [Porphyrobacter sp. YT40]|uniref:hypothetical protein n=1 Tax=Porphyrobacter sp. YT40 TaxID=2547601 RepID=UPI00114458E0|nr:hypothetical protein [Porphyrobacter sp. YT40]QDH34899.1 hypothetical protein E2E27_11535 [Porphyrobacter sp. YT40]